MFLKGSVVVMGGGSGSFQILSGLRPHPGIELRSIVTMMDSGGDSGELRDAFGVLPPGDLRRCLVALSEESATLRDLFSFRFEEEPLRGRNFGNLFILALTKALGSERNAVDALGKILKIRGKVLPVTWEHSQLVAELENGERIRGEGQIDQRVHATGGSGSPSPILSVSLDPPASANIEAIEAIAHCDVIVIAPGDIFTSTIPNLLVEGIPEAIQNSQAVLVQIMNLMTKFGETDGWSAARHVEEVARYAGRRPDAVLVHTGFVPEGPLHLYQEEEAMPVQLDLDATIFGDIVVHDADIVSAQSLIRHDPARTAAALLELADEVLSRRTKRAIPA